MTQIHYLQYNQLSCYVDALAALQHGCDELDLSVIRTGLSFRLVDHERGMGLQEGCHYGSEKPGPAIPSAG